MATIAEHPVGKQPPAQPCTLPESFLQSLVSELDTDNTVGITLAGSYARGEGGRYSDVDIHQFVRQMPANPHEAYRLCYRDGRLVSISLVTLDEEYAGLCDPNKAIWAISGLRQQRILLDKDDSLAALKECAETAAWAALQAAANAHSSWSLAGCAEEVHKILAGLAQGDESKTLYATWGLTRGLADALLIQRGMLIPTENAYLDLAQETAGRTSEWTHQFRLAAGLDHLPPEEPPFIICGKAGLRLYLETAALLQNTILPEDVSVVNRTLNIIEEAGY